MPSRLAKLTTVVSAVVLTAALPANASYPSDQVAGAPRDRGVHVVAAGDIACPPGHARTSSSCQQAATARLVRRIDPAAVLTLGDTQYERGELAEYRSSYAKTWGKLRPMTYPVPGNHEYDSGATGYYHYFRHRQPGRPGWYAYRLGGWWLYALNSECDMISCAAEEAWLRAQLRKHGRGCSLMYMHQPRFSSGTHHGGTNAVEGLWRVAYRYDVDVALAGHEHNYERFGRLDHVGRTVADGIASFVVGTGGKGIYPIGSLEPGSRAHYDNGFGVLVLRLGHGSYGWRFKTIGGAVKDHGASHC